MANQQCIALTRSGTRCRNFACTAGDQTLCMTHLRMVNAGRPVHTVLPQASEESSPKKEATKVDAKGSTSTALPSQIMLVATLGLGLFVSEYAEILALGVPHYIAVNGLDVVGLALGNAPGFLLALLAALAAVIVVVVPLIVLLASIIVVTLMAVGLTLFFLVSPLAAAAYTTNWIVSSIASLFLRITGRIARPENAQLLERLQQRNTRVSDFINLFFETYAKNSLFIASIISRRSVKFAAYLYRAAITPQFPATRFGILFGLLLLISISNLAIAYHYDKRIQITTKGDDIDTACIIANLIGVEALKTQGCWIDRQFNTFAAWIKPVETVHLVFHESHPADASFIALGTPGRAISGDGLSALNFAGKTDLILTPDERVSEEVVYIGDYGDWAVLERQAKNHFAPSERRVLVRRETIVEMAAGTPKLLLAPNNAPGGSTGDATNSNTEASAAAETAARLARVEGQLDVMQRSPIVVPPATVVSIALGVPPLTTQPGGGDESGMVSQETLIRFGLSPAMRDVIDLMLQEKGLISVQVCLDTSKAIETVFFEEGDAQSRDLETKIQDVVTTIANATANVPGPYIVFVRGRASSSGSRRYNSELSERRAEWIAKALRTALSSRYKTALPIFVIPFGAGEIMSIDASSEDRPLAEILLCNLGLHDAGQSEIAQDTKNHRSNK
ncbi:MAG: OmpA family protein [Pseudomonadota bacterium]